MRVDKWLWTARLIKTRALATEAARGGRVHLNGVAIKPGREIGVGDTLELTLGQVRRTVTVLGHAPRRVSPAEAAQLYSESEESVAERARHAELRRLSGPLDVGARPTKRDRRRFDAGRRERSDRAIFDISPPQSEHREAPPQGEHREAPPQGEHREAPPPGEHRHDTDPR